MAQTVQTSIPASISAGDSSQWIIALADYLASEGWVLHYTLNKLGNTINIDSTASGDDHLITITAVVSAAWQAGDYGYVAYVTGPASARVTLAQGQIKIAPNLAAQTGGYDSRTPSKKLLDDLNAALATYGNKAFTQEYSIAGRMMKFTSPSVFMEFRDKVKREVAAEIAAENIKLGKPSGSKIHVRF